ncbi:ABC transporter ATP-binding protein [Chitinophagaceae bacterium LWZ2-11]
MSSPIIKVENLSKLYRLGEVGTGTISHDLNRWWAKVRGKEDPFAKIGETNDRTSKGSSDYVWSLRDVSFDVKQGEVLGIIGRNGAGKSTLLKVLSKVTQPTEGRIKVRGRIASLLEVGTGFHPELTGRENIFLNGAIMGMTRREVKRKFDEIVDFAGVERYVDTPVKRYSSGMYVRLAFAVAAFLEPEILIVDEVLAVGDAEFQKKSLGRMKDVSEKDGRTVLFVSHNMAVISSLCKHTIVLKDGRLYNSGETDRMITEYMRIGESFTGEVIDDSLVEVGKKLKIRSVRIVNENGRISSEVNNTGRAFIEVNFEVFIENRGYDIAFELIHAQHGVIFGSALKDTKLDEFDGTVLRKGLHSYKIELPMQYLRGGDYYINIASAIPKFEILDVFKYQIQFSIIDSVSPVAKTTEGRTGAILPVLEWAKQ